VTCGRSGKDPKPSRICRHPPAGGLRMPDAKVCSQCSDRGEAPWPPILSHSLCSMQFLKPDMIGRIASALGLDRNNTQTAIGAAIPGLLAGLSGVAAQPGGGQRLVDAVRQQTGALGSFANMIGASGQSTLIEKGSQILSSLLGSRDQTALAGAVSKYAGLGQSASGSLLVMLAPIVMGTIGQQQGARSLDAGGIASLLSSRRTTLLRHSPRGLPSCLGAQAYLTRSAARRGQRPRPRARRPGRPLPLPELSAIQVSAPRLLRSTGSIGSFRFWRSLPC